MNPTLILMAVRAALRLARAGDQAFGQYARDRDVMLPLVKEVQFSDRDRVRGFFDMNPDLLTADLQPAWKSFNAQPGAPRIPGDFELLAVERVRQETLKNAALAPLADDAAGLWLVKQWSDSTRPVGPLARMVLTIVDVAAEFAAQDPKLFGIGGNAEVLVQALATHVAEMLPDDPDAPLGPRELLGERLAAMFLKASLSALSEHPDALIEQEHVQVLVKSTLPKLVDSFPATLEEQVKWRNVMDALLGPVANEAMSLVAQDPRAYFGRQFGDDGLLGPLTRSYLQSAAELGLDRTFGKAGAVALYKATVSLAAARPELFVGTPDKSSAKLLAGVFADLAVVARDHSPPFDRDLIAQLAATTLETVGREGSTLLDPDKPWEKVLSQTLTPVLASVVQALRTSDSGALKRLRSPASIESFVRILVTQVARTPGMITSTNNVEVNRLVSAVAAAMAADENLLLSQEEWLAIVAAAAEEVAANPGRLLGVSGAGAAGSLLATLLTDLVRVANEQWKEKGRAGGTVLFGPTLKESMLIAIRASASQSAAALLNTARLKDLAEGLTELMAEKLGKFGSKEWLCVYRALIMQVIETGTLATLDETTINAALAAPAGVPA